DAFIDLAEDSQTNRPLPFHELEPEQARELFEQTTRQLAWPVPGSVECKAIEASSRDGQVLPLRLYIPTGYEPQALPVFMYFHGGGYVVGSLDSHDGVCREFCSRTPCVVVSVGYRRAPEYKFPVALHDCADAVSWLHEAAEKYGLNRREVIFGGDSVGATMAAVLAIQAVHQPGEVAIKPLLQVLCYPMTDASRRSTSIELFAQGYFLESDTLEWFYNHYARTPQDREDWRFSPLLAPDLKGVAPALVVLAGFDPLLDEGRAYVSKLQEQGVTVYLQEYLGLTHDLLRLQAVVPEVADIHQALADRLQQMLSLSKR
ncbi:alpha/beta hydrolase, partial [Serratia proteamaculans]|uniref:alpha/beta hydrolase n=1 Tax=Serratia proteamaculans TaxID=28151 RepID=UPI003D077E73